MGGSWVFERADDKTAGWVFNDLYDLYDLHIEADADQPPTERIAGRRRAS
ncbi:hypothetical protein [Streptomyces camelliae]|uniref:Uncharacterized protein n=1 Tax=Streptomyces camelliae TaxID=3004093 RepID=A0ABY7PHC2_9ACTN|nr:hypothetical protein [Streptomyces sp. HUAS 2-6]WBO68965.1 hypothetical protein O1G22_42430 [Streptomyces sp. HUAS 2-6]